MSLLPGGGGLRGSSPSRGGGSGVARAAARCCGSPMRLFLFVLGAVTGGFVVALGTLASGVVRRSGGESAGRRLAAGGRPRYLVATSTSCEDIVPPKPWLTGASSGEYDGRPRPYDVVVFDYSANHTCRAYIKPRPGLALLHRPRTFKWPAMHGFFTGDDGGKAALEAYSHFLLTDDDVDFHGGVGGVVQLFRLCDEYGFHICQPSLSDRSAVNMDVTAHVLDLPPGAIGRSTKFVEQMSPLFSREALMMMLPYFGGVTHAWGIDALWSDLSYRLERRIGVVDAVQIDHMRPSGVSGLYKRVGGLEKAAADQAAFRARYGVRDEFFDMVKPTGHRGEGEPVTEPVGRRSAGGGGPAGGGGG